MESGMTAPRPLPAKTWTPADDEILRSLAKNGMHTRWIALQMKRTPTEIRRRASGLDILLRQARPQRQMC
jgi:hypothetical protein